MILPAGSSNGLPKNMTCLPLGVGRNDVGALMTDLGKALRDWTRPDSARTGSVETLFVPPYRQQTAVRQHLWFCGVVDERMLMGVIPVGLSLSGTRKR